MKLQRFTLCFFLLLLVTAGAFAQTITGNLTGTVSQAGANLPGVTVTISSPAMQGTRSTVTNENGDYVFQSIPPGTYKVTFALSGLTDVTKTVQVNLSETKRLDADMKMSAVSEAITVTATQASVMETPQIDTNFKQATINRLPMNRNPVAQAALAPGVTGGVNGNTISGAMSYDNLYLVNGAVVNENLRGQAQALYIEDAIQETTVMTGGISAEFGRFTGGVVNAITKSGGNEFTGSFRDSLDNPKWTAKAIPTQTDPINHTNNTYEETLGGRIIRDRLWFFVAGRQSKTSRNSTLSAITTLPNPAIGAYTIASTNPRLEAKLTANLTSKHSIVGSYLRNNTAADINCQLGCLDTRALNTAGVSNPNNFRTLHYNGIITSNFLIEGDWAKRYFAFVNFGGTGPAHQTPLTADYLATYSPAVDQLVTGATFNAPYFCGSCGDELRNNKEYEIKGRYFLGTKSLGTHNMVAGYDNFSEQRLSNNYQSPTDFRYDVRGKTPIQMPDGTVQIALTGSATGAGDRFLYFPVAFASLGSNLKTTSLFVNDKWDFNQHLTFNLGLRHDANNSVDSAGNVVSRDKAFSPRLGVIFDVFGNGRLRLDTNYGKYVGRLAETVSGSASAAGNPATIRFAYAGPNTDYLDSRVALQQAFAWFLANGGTSRAPISQSLPGVNTRLVDSGVQSPDMREITVGAGTNIGKGYFRTDYINRRWENFYAQFNNLSIGTNGTVLNPSTNPPTPTDLNLIGNSSVPTRKYWGLQFQGQYQLPAGFGVGGNYTYSKLRGNTEGETSGSGPVPFAASTVSYPEILGFSQNAPVGYLVADQRHKLRLWGSVDIPTPIGHFNIGAIERFDSGSPFSAAASIPLTVNMLCSGIPTPAAGNSIVFTQNTTTSNCAYQERAGSTVVRSGTGTPVYPNGSPRNPSAQYANMPTSFTYFFGDRGQYRWDNLYATDLAVNYELPIRNFALFAKGEVRNVFNHLAVLSGNTTVLTATNSGALAPFNPFTDTPVQCTAATVSACPAGTNYFINPTTFGQTNGTPTTFSTTGNYQLPRTYLFSFGARF